MFFTKCISCQSKNRFVKNNMCMLTFFNIGSDLKSLNLCSKILIYAVLSRGKFCREFTHFFGVLFLGKKIRWRTKNDYYQVWGEGGWGGRERGLPDVLLLAQIGPPLTAARQQTDVTIKITITQCSNGINTL